MLSNEVRVSTWPEKQPNSPFVSRLSPKPCLQTVAFQVLHSCDGLVNIHPQNDFPHVSKTTAWPFSSFLTSFLPGDAHLHHYRTPFYPFRLDCFAFPFPLQMIRETQHLRAVIPTTLFSNCRCSHKVEFPITPSTPRTERGAEAIPVTWVGNGALQEHEAPWHVAQGHAVGTEGVRDGAAGRSWRGTWRWWKGTARIRRIPSAPFVQPSSGYWGGTSFPGSDQASLEDARARGSLWTWGKVSNVINRVDQFW